MGSDDVRRVALRVQRIGDEVRRMASQMPAIGAAQWLSPAGQGFRRQLGEEAGRVHSVGLALDGVTDALNRHAAAIESGPGWPELGGGR